MRVPSHPENELERQAILDRHGLSSESQSRELDAIVSLAADILECPIALVSIVDGEVQRFKAKVGLNISTTTRDISFCGHAILESGTFVVEDATADDRFHDNPMVTGDPNIRFYAGVPISTDGVHNLGTLCVIDRKPRSLTVDQERQLKKLATTVEGLLRAFESEDKALRVAEQLNKEVRQAQRTATLLDRITEVSGVGGWELSLETDELFWTDQTKRIHEVPLDYEPDLQTAVDFYEPESADMIAAVVGDSIENQTSWDVEAELITAKGRRIWVHTVGTPIVENGKITRLLGTFRDISEQKEFEQKLQLSDASSRRNSMELRAILDHMDQGVSVFDSDARLTTWNQNYIDIFEKPEGEITEGAFFHDLLQSEADRGDFKGDVDEHLNDLYSRLAEGETVSSEFRLNDEKVILASHVPMPNGGWVGTHTDVTERVRAEEKVRHASLHDALTGLPNRMKLEQDFQTWICQALEDDDEIALIMLDLNKFKETNDTFGHHIGDKLLQLVAERLRTVVRKDDIVARLGGDEFAILLKCTKESAQRALERLAASVVQLLTEPFVVEGQKITIGCSIGISLAGEAANDYEKQMQNSDAAMYQSKRSGQSGFVFYTVH